MISTRRHSHWLIALLILVFVGQSMAVVAMPCQLMTENTSTPHAVANMDHSMMGMHHDMGQMDQSNSSHNMSKTHDCCKTMGHCSSGSYSAPALSYSSFIWAPIGSNQVADYYLLNVPKNPVTSLYRPPIFR